ncbi:MAG: hypothetical protein CFE43_09580 [Burkholderiales bacterium PBB3]|nr:MAG: hypothetical protein CFE43_09580 [Burkholderiales bacterium PBB3]
MTLNLTFKDVCITIKKQGKDDPKLIEAVDQLLGLALICSPMVLGPAAVALLPTLAVKNEVIKIGKSVFEKLGKRKDDDYLERQATMQMAYGLLVFTSFFDALDTKLPKTLRDAIGILEPEKVFLVKDAIEKTQTKGVELANVHACELSDAPVANISYAFPHPTETLTEQTTRQVNLWVQMGQGFIEFIQSLSIWEEAEEKSQLQILNSLKGIEHEAARMYEAQYFELAKKFDDFAIWANLQEHRNAKALIGELSENVKRHAKLSVASEKAIDVGFTKLQEVVQRLPETFHITQAEDLAASLNRHYQARICEPILDNKDDADGEVPRLSFPIVREAFVPQSFHVLRKSGKTGRLEEESTWKGLARRNDLGAFLLSYLTSPYSTEAPLLILGHPGSGKSLLTKILAAQLMSKQFIVIRVPLREVNADADIVTQIEDGIRRITNVSVDSWIKLSALFQNCPPIVILDGYDELLQASGEVFAGYVKDAQRFQQKEAEQGRPLRIVITSRVTLIDKANVPVGTTVVRLLEFDKAQRECWSTIWNRSNVNFFRESSIDKFMLPDEKDSGAEKILTLAAQPLLLLMLALYDSEGNQLRLNKGIDRTKLYDRLLRRFVTRERSKEKGFENINKRERNRALDFEMQRLGVAALGMYNRRKVHILSTELDDDLGFFKLGRPIDSKQGRALSQAELLLGSFFFVHQSKAQHNNGADDTHEETSAFEFLHNTFGEFLTADFILRRAVAQVQALRAFETNDALRSQLDKLMGTADGFEIDWFSSLVYTPLSSRPVIMEMIREWAPHVLKEQTLRESDFVESLEKIVLNQIRRLLNKREMPSIIRKDTAQEGHRVPFGDHPLIGHVAIYSMNLILLRVVVGTDSFVFDESQILSHEDGTRPWDRIVHIWRSWFALDNLNELTAVMLATRAESKITIAATQKFHPKEAKNRAHECLNVANALGDRVESGLFGLLLFDPTNSTPTELDRIEQQLTLEGLDLGLTLAAKRLLTLAADMPNSFKEFVSLGANTLDLAVRRGRRDELEHLCLIVSRTLSRHIEAFGVNRGFRFNDDYIAFRNLFDPAMAAAVAFRDARSGRLLWDIATQVSDYEWQEEFLLRMVDRPMRDSSGRGTTEPNWSNGVELLQLIRDVGGSGMLLRSDLRGRPSKFFLERVLHPRHLQELIQRDPDSALVYIQMIQEFGGTRVLERFSREAWGKDFFEKIFHPKHLLELGERNPEGALAFIQLLHQIDGGRYVERYAGKRFGPTFFEQVLSPGRLQEMSERNPGGALAYIQLLRQFGGGKVIDGYNATRIGSEFFERMADAQHLLRIGARNPEGALAYLQLLRELGGADFLAQRVDADFDQIVLRRMLSPIHVMEMGARNPEKALAYIQLIREMGGVRLVERYGAKEFGSEFIEEGLSVAHLNQVFDRKPTAIAVYLVFARLANNRRITEPLRQAIRSFFARRGGSKICMALLPISSVPDLYWLADQTKDKELKTAISQLIGREEFED